MLKARAASEIPAIASWSWYSDIWSFGIAEVQAVGERHRLSANARYVAARFGNGDRGTGAGIEIDEPPVTVGGDRQGALRSLDAQQCGVTTWRNDSVVLDLMVVLPPDGVLRCDVWRCEQFQQRIVRRDIEFGQLGQVSILKLF